MKIVRLYALDKNDEYLRILRDNLNHFLKHARHDKGLFAKDWNSEDNSVKPRWLLDQAAMVEMYAALGKYF